MKLLASIAALLALSACGAPAPYRQAALSNAPVDVALRECSYEADKATANIRSGIEAGYMQATLERKCMAAKGFTR